MQFLVMRIENQFRKKKNSHGMNRMPKPMHDVGGNDAKLLVIRVIHAGKSNLNDSQRIIIGVVECVHII